MTHPPQKQQCVGGAYHDPVPFTTNFSTVHTWEGRLRHIRNELLTTPAERSPQHEVDSTWNSAASWLPVNDPQFALDPDGKWYDEVVDSDVMQDHIAMDGPVFATRPKARVQSKVSVSQDFFEVILQFDPLLVKTSCHVERPPSPNLSR